MPLEIQSPSTQVANYLRSEIEAGRWQAEFPGTPALGKELEVDRKTIIAAIQQLEDEGLLQSQGPGRPRRVIRQAHHQRARLNIRFMVHEDDDRQRAHVMGLLPKIQELGHHIEIDHKTLTSLGMNLNRVKQHVKTHPADAWILLSATREILEWFAQQKTPALAMFGRRRQVPIASIGPDKAAAIRNCVDRLVALGHRRIVLMAREERRKPTPGYIENEFLKALEIHGIIPSPYHLPEWDDRPESFHNCLDALFRFTPPTALIFDEAQFYVAALQHFAQWNLSVPRDLSMVSCDTHPLFDWCRPSVSHIHWEPQPIIRHVTKWFMQLGHGSNDKQACFTPAQFIEGGSIGPAANHPDP